MVLSLLLAGCGGPPPDPVEQQAQRYVSLGLAYARIDEQALDTYFGPEDLRQPPPGIVDDVGAIREDLVALRSAVAANAGSGRRDRLVARIDDFLTLIAVSEEPGALSFDEEARRLYDITVPPPNEETLRRARAELDALLPGAGSLAERVARFQAGFIVPEDRREEVFRRALAECRARTAAHWPLASDETLDIEWTQGAGAAWHRYQGNGRSVLQINPAAIAHIGGALDIACHEAYPGHHAQFLMMDETDEGEGGDEGGQPVEETLVFIRSPGQVLREGAAQYGVDLAFPPEQRAVFLSETLLPLAGLDATSAGRFVQVQDALVTLAAAATPILRDYLDGRRTRFDAGNALANEALIASPDALLRFVRDNRSYVLGYSVARDLVQRCVEARAAAAGDGADTPGAARWQALRTIVAKTDLAAFEGNACGA